MNLNTMHAHKLPTIWTDEQPESEVRGEKRREAKRREGKRREKARRSEKRKGQKKENEGAQKKV